MAETKPKTTKKTSTSKKTQVTKTANTSTKKTTKTTTKNGPKSTPKTIKTTKITPSEKPTIKIEQKDREVNTVLTVIGIIVLVIVAILIFRLTYAYFTVMIDDKNPNNTDVVVKTADLLIHYEDGSSNIELGSKIEPGDIITKEFSVVNDGNDMGEYAIALQNIEHNLGHQISEEDETLISDIKYTLSKVDSTGGKTTMGTGTLPFSASEYIIYTKDEVEYEQTNKYILEVEYINYTNIDQSDSMGEKLELKVNIINYEGEQRTQDTEY